MTNLEAHITQHPTKQYEKDQVILFQGETPANVFIIKSGYVKGYDISPDGNEQVVWLGSRGDLFSYDWLFSATDSTQLLYGAFSNTELYVLNRRDLLAYLQQRPETLLEMTRKMATTLTDLVTKLAAAEKPKASEKIAHVLHMLADRFSLPGTPRESAELALPLTQQDLANLVGLTRETVAAELKKLRNGGYIDYDKMRFIVHDRRLAELL
jgi:CRP/FNR family cyclic AMP-dependent transcriptional regulator